MIDVENKVFDTVYNALIAHNPNIKVYGEAVEKSATFPAVTVAETDNYPYRLSETEAEIENHAILIYEINAYSNKQNDSKLECKAIIKVADQAMREMGFRRLLCRRTPNMDRTIYRIYARYEAIVSKAYEEDGNTVYKISRR